MKKGLTTTDKFLNILMDGQQHLTEKLRKKFPSAAKIVYGLRKRGYKITFKAGKVPPAGNSYQLMVGKKK